MAGEYQLDAVRKAGQQRTFSTTMARTVAGMVLAALLLSGAGLYWAAHESDVVSAERQARTARHAMESSVDELALQQETVSIWDDAASHLVADRRDMTWIHDNIGRWLNRMFGHDEVFILDRSDRPIYAAVMGAQVPLERYQQRSGDVEYLVNSVRGRHGRLNGRHDRNPRAPLDVGSTVRTTARATHDSHLMLVGGRPAAASAMLIQPSTPNYVQPKGQWPVLISIRYLDRGFLAELSSRQLISAPRFSRSSKQQAGEHVIPLVTEWGKTIGFLAWKPELPGTRILWRLVPLTLLVLIALAALMAFLGRRLRNAVGELATAEAHAAHLAFHDPLTGLPNRALFQRRLDELTRSDHLAPPFALLLLDVDEFKLTNDTLGHDAGDAVLLGFADRLRCAVRPDDLVARLGGDEFALLLMGANQPGEVESFSNQLFDRLRQPYEHDGRPIHCNASIGASIYTGRDSAADMLKHADLALYESKSSGRGMFRLYDPLMWSKMIIRQEMLSVAKGSLEGGFIRPFYQPKVNLETGEVVGFEALLRCCLPGKEPLGPDYLAAAFEDSVLAADISDRMVEGVIEDVLVWQSAGLRFGHVAINAAAAELRRGDFSERLLSRLTHAAISPECIQVEVTESVLVGRGIEHVERTFKELAANGVRLALDDFGTGFASLSHLKRFPVQIIKIDRTFIRDLQVDADDGAIVDALIGLGQALGIDVVAEGIETTAQRDFLAALGCAIGQGYLFGGAMPAASVPQLLRKSMRGQRSAAA